MSDLLSEANTERRFCGRCQSWVPDVIEIHHCVRAPRPTKQSEGDTKWIAYGWYEHDEPAIEKNSIIQESRPFKRGELIEKYEIDG